MVKNFDPCDSTGSMHYYIRELDHDVKFCYNYNSSYAYDDGIPKQWPGLKKGKEATKAYNVEKKIFQKAAEKTLGLPIGKYFRSKILEIRFHCIRNAKRAYFQCGNLEFLLPLRFYVKSNCSL